MNSKNINKPGPHISPPSCCDAPVALPWLAVLQINGADAGTFLDRQLTVNVTDLGVGDSRIGSWCDAKGRSLCTLWIKRNASAADVHRFTLGLHASLLESIAQRLRLYVLRAAVTVTVAEDQLMSVAAAAIAEPPRQCWQALDCHARAGTVYDSDAASQWRKVEIDSGFIWLDEHSSGEYLPQMLAMERWQALDYRKGCFPGQEVIARAHYLGRVKRGLFRLRLQSSANCSPAIGARLTNPAGIECGKILALAGSAGDYIALGVLQFDDKQTDTVLFYECNGLNFTVNGIERID